jgi:outer membrane protein assembly factor BamB
MGTCLAKRREDRPTAPELGGMLGPVVAAGFSDSVVALDAATGWTRWSKSLALVTESPRDLGAVGDVLVAQVAEGAAIQGLDLASGAPRWSLPEAGETFRSSLLGADGLVYAKLVNGPTCAYDGVSGSPRWAYGGDPFRMPVAARGPTRTSSPR